MITTQRPGADEYGPGVAEYIARIADGEDILAVLDRQLDLVVARLESIPEAHGDYRYAPEKWSIKEIVGHLSDAERIFSYRALRFGRGDSTPLPGYEENDYVPAMEADELALSDLVGQWADVRRATIALFRTLPSSGWDRRGLASNHPISVRALAYAIAGHMRHHLEVLDARYLSQIDLT